MQNSMGIVWAIIIGIIVLAGGYWLFMSTGTDTDVNVQANTGANTATNTGSNTAPMTATVTYSDSGFSPSSITVKRGGTVTWQNNSDGDMWVASAQHPTHMVYSGTDREDHCPDTDNTAFDQCEASEGDYSFTFDKVGTWNYHDHIDASRFGSVTVVE